MKRMMIKLVAGMAIISQVFYFASCDKEEDGNNDTMDTQLTIQEKEDLLVLREEEKLARDVYTYAYQKHGIMVHKNISKSEQTHMDKVLETLTFYGLNDPASDSVGVFNNADLQQLYTSLCTLVDSSSLQSLLVGATIEDLDIHDINISISHTDKEDILEMYNKLNCGSRNHMRSFYKQITANNSSYSPQFISQAEFDDIINSDKESCN